jgi:hypothetical protein
MKNPGAEPKRSYLRAIILGLLLPIALGPVAFGAVVLASRWFPGSLLTSYVGALNTVLFALVPEGTYKGVLVPVATVVGAYVLPVGVLTSSVSWPILRSAWLALIAGAVATVMSVIGIMLVVILAFAV